ncbi:hypothetical protein FA15DRAFT_706922 [Coprinopsis marcescibilis]|uniref:Uncharacterized protein n=1 Tax=Coprinopsis marcescibilis TaxID=230819 RepID=A0A5C3KNM8_COPMA|nr:hypothetical protein FA15DRAFT_706922 [Coprinopsis marcescibilis]
MDLPPELLREVASHVPLYVRPPTLLSLALTDRRTSKAMLQVLWNNVVVKSDRVAELALRQLSEDSTKGPMVTGIYFLFTNLAAEGYSDEDEDDPSILPHRGFRQRPNALRALAALEELVSRGLLSRLRTLASQSWEYRRHTGKFYMAPLHGLTPSFWSTIGNIPQLRTLVLGCTSLTSVLHLGAADKLNHSPDDEPLGVFGLKNVRRFSLTLSCRDLRHTTYVSRLTTQLRALSLGAESTSLSSIDLAPVLELEFPVLEAIYVRAYDIQNSATRFTLFWQRHPTLQSIDIGSKSPAFPEDIASQTGFLPNLTKITATFLNVRLITPILHQLTSLVILDPVEAQVPYLLREIIPAKLSRLRSLTIRQLQYIPSGLSLESPFAKDVLKDIENSASVQETGHPHDFVLDAHLCLIAQAAPLLEEFTWIIRGPRGIEEVYNTIGPGLRNFKRLQRFFFPSFFNTDDKDIEHQTRVDHLKEYASKFAQDCPTLATLGDTSTPLDPTQVARGYELLRTVRDGHGQFVDAKLDFGYGMVYGQEENAFPLPDYSML